MFKAIWRTCCSLKLAIVLASIATLLNMGGSLVMHFNPDVFGNLDALTLSEWTDTAGAPNKALSWWLYATGLLVLLLAVNTLCCFVDWLAVFRSRWRKSGEYLIHIGFVMVVAAYFWGSLGGSRSQGNRIAEGETIAVEALPGHYLRLDRFDPVYNEQGRPIDMKSSVSLFKADAIVAQAVVKTNTPLLYRGLVVTPSSYEQIATGFEILVPSVGKGFRLTPGDAVPLPDGFRVVADAFYPDAVQIGEGVARRSDNLRNPAYRLRLLKEGKEVWRGWYFLTRPGPEILTNAGFRFVVNQPVFRTYSILTINLDPGSGLALAGAICISLGVILALYSFYRKRSRGDRPEID